MHAISKLYNFQTEDVRRIRDLNGRALLANEVGLGKTITALNYAWKFLPDKPPGPVVAVVPSHLKLNWQREALRHLGLRAEVLGGQRVPDGKRPPQDPNQVYIVNYDVLVPPNWPARAPLPPDSWAAFLCGLAPRLVILDEAQMVKSPRTARTRACRKLCRRAPHVLLLTGTPLANRPVDLWSLVSLVDPSIFPSFHDFAVEFTHARKKWYGWEYKGARNLDRLHVLLERRCMIRRRKADVLDQLPAVTLTVVPIDVDLAEYNKAEEDYVNWVEQQSPGAGARAAQAEELARLTGLRQLAAKLKIEAVVDWCRALLEESDGKLLIGAVHHAITRRLMEAFGRGAVLADGTMDHEQKHAAFERFNRHPACRVLVGNIQAAGTGWSCQATSDVAFAELPWRPDEVAQLIGRCHGLNRGEAGVAAHARFLVAAGTIEEDLCEVLERKQTWANIAVDGDPAATVLDVHTQVKAAIRCRRRGD